MTGPAPRTIKGVFRDALNRDPWTFLVGHALWAVISAISMLAPGNVMQMNSAYAWLREIPIQEEAWGVMMLADAIALACALHSRRLAMRIPVAFLSGAFWVLWGGGQLVGATAAGFIPITGCWNVVAGLGCYLAVIQWLNRQRPA